MNNQIDLILKNANVITVDPQLPAAQLVAVKDGKIIFVGGKDQLNQLQGVGTKIIDCAGKTLVPSFNDAHCHIFSLVRKLLSLDISPPAVKSIADINAAVKRKAEVTPQGQWIVGTDYNDFYLAEKRHPTRWELDEVSPDNPVILSHRSLHACVLNSSALALAHITTETAEPPGALISRDVSSGEPDGLLLEMLGFLHQKVLPPLSQEEIDSGIKLANDYYLSQGLTSLQDATYVNDLKRWQHHRRFKETGLLKSRVYMMVGTDTLPQFLEAGLSFRSGDDDLRLGAVKFVPNMSSGTLYPSQSELEQRILNAHKAGFQVAVHAVQEKLVAAIVGAFEYVRDQTPDFTIRRHRLEHLAECPPHILERIKRLKMVVATHPTFAYYSGDRYLATVAPAMIPYLYPLKSLLNAGLVVAGASDSPVVPSNPLIGIYGGVTRKTSAGQAMSPEQRVSAADVLKLYTVHAAYASHDEDIKGSLTPGKLADMVLLNSDPTKVPDEAIKDINVEMTVIGGKIVWEG